MTSTKRKTSSEADEGPHFGQEVPRVYVVPQRRWISYQWQKSCKNSRRLHLDRAPWASLGDSCSLRLQGAFWDSEKERCLRYGKVQHFICSWYRIGCEATHRVPDSGRCQILLPQSYIQGHSHPADTWPNYPGLCSQTSHERFWRALWNWFLRSRCVYALAGSIQIDTDSTQATHDTISRGLALARHSVHRDRQQVGRYLRSSTRLRKEEQTQSKSSATLLLDTDQTNHEPAQAKTLT